MELTEDGIDGGWNKILDIINGINKKRTKFTILKNHQKIEEFFNITSAVMYLPGLGY